MTDKREAVEFALMTKLSPYIPSVREFWKTIDRVNTIKPGVHICDENDDLSYFVGKTITRTPLKYVPIFPFIKISQLNIVGLACDIDTHVRGVCDGDSFTLDDFVITYVRSRTFFGYTAGVLAFIPKDVYESTKSIGHVVYITKAEAETILRGNSIPSSFRNRVIDVFGENI